jgi:hypothetical protein
VRRFSTGKVTGLALLDWHCSVPFKQGMEQASLAQKNRQPYLLHNAQNSAGIDNKKMKIEVLEAAAAAGAGASTGAWSCRRSCPSWQRRKQYELMLNCRGGRVQEAASGGLSVVNDLDSGSFNVEFVDQDTGCLPPGKHLTLAKRNTSGVRMTHRQHTTIAAISHANHSSPPPNWTHMQTRVHLDAMPLLYVTLEKPSMCLVLLTHLVQSRGFQL